MMNYGMRFRGNTPLAESQHTAPYGSRLLDQCVLVASVVPDPGKHGDHQVHQDCHHQNNIIELLCKCFDVRWEKPGRYYR